MSSKWSRLLPYTEVAQDASVDDSFDEEHVLSSGMTRRSRFWSLLTSAFLVALAGATGFLIGNRTSHGEPWGGNFTDTVPQGSALLLRPVLLLIKIVWLSPYRMVQSGFPIQQQLRCRASKGRWTRAGLGLHDSQ